MHSKGLKTDLYKHLRKYKKCTKWKQIKMIYKQFSMFIGGAETLHLKTGVENLSLWWRGDVSKL